MRRSSSLAASDLCGESNHEGFSVRDAGVPSPCLVLLRNEWCGDDDRERDDLDEDGDREYFELERSCGRDRGVRPGEAFLVPRSGVLHRS